MKKFKKYFDDLTNISEGSRKELFALAKMQTFKKDAMVLYAGAVSRKEYFIERVLYGLLLPTRRATSKLRVSFWRGALLL